MANDSQAFWGYSPGHLRAISGKKKHGNSSGFTSGYHTFAYLTWSLSASRPYQKPQYEWKPWWYSAPIATPNLPSALPTYPSIKRYTAKGVHHKKCQLTSESAKLIADMLTLVVLGFFHHTPSRAQEGGGQPQDSKRTAVWGVENRLALYGLGAERGVD